MFVSSGIFVTCGLIAVWNFCGLDGFICDSM